MCVHPANNNENYHMIFRFWNSTNHSIILLIRNSFNWINIINVEHSRSDQLGYACTHSNSNTNTCRRQQLLLPHSKRAHRLWQAAYWKINYSKAPVHNDMSLCVYNIAIAIAFDRFILVRSLSLYLRECERWWNWVMANAKHHFVDRSEILFAFSSDVCSPSCFFIIFSFEWLEKSSNLNIMFVLTTPQSRDTASNSAPSMRSFVQFEYIILWFGCSVSRNSNGEFQRKHLPALIHRKIIANIIQFLGNPMFVGRVFVQCTSIQLSTRKHALLHCYTELLYFLFSLYQLESFDFLFSFSFDLIFFYLLACNDQ